MADTLVFGRVKGVGSDIPEYTRTIRAGDTITGLDNKILKSSASGVLEGITDNSTTWDSVAAIVNAKYTGWDSTKTTVDAGATGWDATKTTVDAGASDWDAAVSTLASKESGWDATKVTVDAGASSWNGAVSTLASKESGWDSTKTTVDSKYAGWDATKTTVDAGSSTWDKASILTDSGSATNFLAEDGTYYAISFSPAGLDTQVQFNDGGSLAGNAGFTYSDGLVLEAQDSAHKPLIVTAHASQSANILEINGPRGSNGSFWRFLNTGVMRAGTNGDFSQPVYQFGNSNNGLYLDSNRIFIKAGGAFAGGFSSIGYQGNSALMDTIVSLDNLTSPRFIGYRTTAAGLKAGLGGNSTGDASLITNNVARITASVAGVVTISGSLVTAGIATTRPTTVGELYQETAANILSNGDLVVGIRQ